MQFPVLGGGHSGDFQKVPVNCINCEKEEKCQEEYFQNLESALKQYLEWREYDEFYQLRDCIDKIVSAVRKDTDIIMPDDIYNEFEREKNRVNALMHRRLPKVKKFSDLITAISVPASIISAASEAALPITVGTAALSGVSTLTSVVANRIEEKHKWVNFCMKN